MSSFVLHGHANLTHIEVGLNFKIFPFKKYVVFLSIQSKPCTQNSAMQGHCLRDTLKLYGQTSYQNFFRSILTEKKSRNIPNSKGVDFEHFTTCHIPHSHPIF